MKLVLEEGAGWELYQEPFDPSSICLRLHNITSDSESPSFEVVSNSLGTEIMVRIPVELWQLLRQLEPKPLDLLDKIEDHECQD